jgi:hypothetical protein
MKFAVLLGVVVVVVAGAWLGWDFFQNQAPTEPQDLGNTTTTNEDLQITKTDLSNSQSRVPNGFPSNIPIESAGITDSSKAESSSETSYTVSYTSRKTKDEIWVLYSDFMMGSGYNIDRQVSSKSLGQIRGVKVGDTLTVIISTRSGLSYVQLSLTDK